MATNAEKIGGAIPEGFTPDVIEQETIVSRKPHYFLGLNQSKIICSIPAEKERFKQSSVSRIDK